MPLYDRMRVLRDLDAEYMRLSDIHYRNAPRNGAIPVGGGEWMDTFFRMEGVRGMIRCLRNGLSLRKALDHGKVASEIAVRLWNSNREYQVHRWDQTCHDYLETLVRRIWPGALA